MMWFLFICWFFAYFLDVFVVSPVLEFSISEAGQCSIEQAFRESRDGDTMRCGDFMIRRVRNTLIITKTK